jgi:cellulose synthase/poly-beta-1,6-N-acetylglucosamine synthase-like glycosyltransferase
LDLKIFIYMELRSDIMEILSLIVLAISFIMLQFSLFCLLTFLDNFDNFFKDPKAKKKYFISAIIPAYNEEQCIEKTIMSIHNQNYDKDLFEIIVSNDGSTDNTKKICKKLQKKGIIKLINKTNGGKANAINHVLKIAKGELIFILDADSYAEPNCMKILTGYFNDKKVAAVSSSMKASDQKGIVKKMQWLEYIFAIFLRKIQSMFNALYVTPGPGSMYKKSVLEEIGGFNEDTLTEDMEIAFNIQDHDYKIEHSLNSIVYTNTPKSFKELFLQRKRWYTGSIEDALSYKHFFFNKKKGMLGSFLMPVNWTIIFMTIILFSYYSLKFIISFLENVLRLKMINFELIFKLPNFSFMFLGIELPSIILLIISIYSLIVLYFSIKISGERASVKKNFFYYIFYLFFYSIFQSLSWIVSFINKIFFRRKKRGWSNA